MRAAWRIWIMILAGGVIDIGLKNVAVAAARVVEGPCRRGLNKVQKRRCLQNVCKNHFSMGSRANSADRPGRAFNIRGNPNSKLLLGNII